MKRRKVLFVQLSHIHLMAKKCAVVLLFLAAFAMMLFNKTDSILIDKTSSVATDVFSPVVDLLVVPAKIVSNVLNYAYDFKNIRRENKKLREENRELIIKSSRVASLEAENRLLSNLLDYIPPQDATFATAKIVAEEGGAFSHSLIAYTAENDKVQKGQVVLGDTGVIGRVERVGHIYSQIILITDINSKIPVMIEKSRVRGILSGDNTSFPRLIFMPLDAEPAIGDKIVTSGVAGVFPAGLPVGKIVAIEKNNIKVKPFGNLDRVEFIRIVDYHLSDVSYEEDIAHSEGAED